MAQLSTIPDFDSLPKVKGMPQGCAWGVFDKDGKKDHLGTLNLITPDVVQEAVKEVRDGVSISLNWSLGAIAEAGFGRRALKHNVIDMSEGALRTVAFDDEVSFNTQCSSQWDSLVHVAHQPTGLHYNGTRPRKDDLVQPYGKVDVDKALPTLNHWHERGCMVGRGVLLDYREYAREHGIKYDCFDAHAISVQDLEAVAKYQCTTFKHGDILLIRTGYTEELDGLDAQGQARLLGTHKAVGVKGNRESARWIWNHHFAAVAGDQVAFEVIPPTIEEDNNRVGGLNELVLHQYFLSLFGLCIGELWDLKALGEHCRKVRRYEFLLTSAPLNVPGSVGSPPNALAIF
ncbi:uncharacterized protein A1O5_12715 [Cladophialophora psammophila CBS 110553]|uniref:Cyclase n=1 Tax=Cladophialophora psammophila CBS 110553 TaxID=1182543 RepID=W9WCL1_9EURO|nr:uncharacterized protein A1O5_12715 [Cladophialophora psammophila CBS 110553]EXJ56259.1 hypothetical protein A1O5_12715 [Cladophialophora psammophila CBS 110553]